MCFEIEKPPEISPLLPVYSKERFFRKRRWLSDHREINVRYLAAVYAFHRADTSLGQQVFSMQVMNAQAKDSNQHKRNLHKQVEIDVPVKK